MNFVAGVAICGLALLTFFQFPGHTWLQQDTQIYTPILQHLRDPGVLDRDLMVQYPHVSFTLYDELTLGLQRATNFDLEHVLGGEQRRGDEGRPVVDLVQQVVHICLRRMLS